MTPVEKATLLDIIDDIRAHVEADDSYEGFLNYLMPDPDVPEQKDADFVVEARYRVGNRMGQGGMRMFGVEIGDRLAPLRARLHEFFHVGEPSTWACGGDVDRCALSRTAVQPMLAIFEEYR